MTKILDGVDNLLISRLIIREVLSVLATKFSRDKEELSRVAVVLGEMGEMVEPLHRLSVFRDEPDNRILECAVEGKADAIVTGDKQMLKLESHGIIRTMAIRQFLNS